MTSLGAIVIGIYAEAIVLLDGGPQPFFITEYSEERSGWGDGRGAASDQCRGGLAIEEYQRSFRSNLSIA